ncbi:splicing factor, suppressor of white-apricot homolog [Asterias rubens]|uniref:splicing factor, suppressor of white-apricot homolog n=1 Tax=Asterias rubens TaxID=7604 RepID=UPI0014559B6A|nr:splicing factor, suppressor of white-apricot homolog [Asterias rubens]
MAQISKKMKNKRAQLLDVKKIDAEKSRQREIEEINVVGYQCKLFRDDERALAIDRGEHLIPWMGDSSLQIDRYDGRAHLHSLSEYQSVGWVSSRQNISAEEERIEAVCDEERYMALHKDMMEEEQRQEEEVKRLNIAIASSDSSYMYNEVAFSYGAGNDEYDPMKPTEDESEQFAKTPPRCESPELEEPFIAPEELNIPVGVQMPGTRKTHKFMEKTAMFIVGQGLQMEIILKTKQANNPQFAFLQFDHYLNPYYKHLLKCIKSGKYKPLPEEEENHKNKGGKNRVRRNSNDEDDDEDDDDDDDDNDNSGYLHPSLLSKPRPTPMQTGTTTIHTSLPPVSSYPPMDFSKPPPIMGYHDPNFLGPSADRSGMAPSGYYDPNMYSMFPPPPPPPPTDGSGIALSLPTVPPPPYAGMDPQYVMSSINPNHHAPLSRDTSTLPHQDSPSVPPMSSNMAGSSPSTDSSESEVHQVIPPPPDIQPVIDKLAKYVAKNGNDFEASVRSKTDPRFDFLLPWHKYNAYYMQKKKMYVKEMGGIMEEGDDNPKKVSVSFSIKSKGPKEERPLERKSALPIESSDSENEDERPQPKPLPQGFMDSDIIPPAFRRPIREELERHRNIPREDEIRSGDREGQRSWGDYPGQPRFNPAFRDGPHGEGNNPPYEGYYHEGYREPPPYREPGCAEYQEHPGTSAELGLSRLRTGFDRGRMTEEEWEIKQVKMRLEDRLAHAAREKMAFASKDRIQQMERRKKAAVFLSMIKDRPQAGAAAEIDIIDTDVNDIPTESNSPPPEKQQRIHSNERKRHKKHKHKHSSRHSPSPERKHKRPPRSYQGGNRVSKETEPKQRSRSISPGGKSRPVTPPRSYQTGHNRSQKQRRRSKSRSTSPIRPLRTSGSSPRRSSSLGATGTHVPSKSRSQSPENNNKEEIAATSIMPPLQEDHSPPPPPIAIHTENLIKETSDSNSPTELLKEPTEENGSSVSAPKEAGQKDDFRAKIRAMLAATRQMDFEPS